MRYLRKLVELALLRNLIQLFKNYDWDTALNEGAISGGGFC